MTRGRLRPCIHCGSRVLPDAETCPHCGGRLGAGARRRLLTPGAWSFIAMLLALFAVFDTVYLLGEKQEEERRVRVARDFLESWFRGEEVQPYRAVNDRHMTLMLEHWTGRYGEILPVELVRLMDLERTSDEGHFRVPKPQGSPGGSTSYVNSCYRYGFQALLHARGSWHTARGELLLSAYDNPRVEHMELHKVEELGSKLPPRYNRWLVALPEERIPPFPDRDQEDR